MQLRPSRPVPMLRNLCGISAAATTTSPTPASISSLPTVNRTFPARTIQVSGEGCGCRDEPRPGSLWTWKKEAPEPENAPANHTLPLVGR